MSAYVLLLTDEYPPFSLAEEPDYPVRIRIDYGDVGQRRTVEHPEGGGHLVGCVGRPGQPAAQHRFGVPAIPQTIIPAYVVSNGKMANSRAVTMPKLPPPPRIAQKSSAFSVRTATRWSRRP